MSDDLKFRSDHTGEDIVNWVISRAEASREPGSTLPAWMIGAFKDAMKRETGVKDSEKTTQGEYKDEESSKTDDIFNFELVYFKVEDTVFTVIKDWLTIEGSPFQVMFTLPAVGSTLAEVEGTRITNPIVLEQTSAVSFRAFLCLLYGPRGNPLQTYDEWVGALELAVRWNFDQIRQQALAGLNSLLPSLGPAARILLARKFSVGPWLRAGLADLVTEVAEGKLDRTALTDESGFALDMITVANIFFACFELESLNRGFRSSAHGERHLQLDCAHLSFKYAYRIDDNGLEEEYRRWHHHDPDVECRSCISLRENHLKAVGNIVDSIFGPEIERCLYNEGL